jgi:hypothetical protein
MPTEGEVATDRPALPARHCRNQSALLSRNRASANPRTSSPPAQSVARILVPSLRLRDLVVDDDASDDRVLVVDVTFRLSRMWGVPVRAEFTCPDSRTIVMRITEGEGMGSVVETHATPLGLGADGRPRTM